MQSISQNDKNREELLPVKKLYPDLTPEELAEAEDALKRYVALVWRIYRRVSREKNKKFDENPFKR